MIEIKEFTGWIMVKGHAGPAPDLVCEDVTALYQGLVLALDELTQDHVISMAEKGFALLAYQRPISEQGRLLIEAFFVGVCAISNAFPDKVRVTRRHVVKKGRQTNLKVFKKRKGTEK